jgi:hypothetical protein
MVTNLVKDLSVITTLPEATLNKLWSRGSECIGHSVLECIKMGDDMAIIESPIGDIKIILTPDGIHYRFTPSQSLEKILVDAIIDKKDPLVTSIEEGLVNRILNAYKDLI